MFPVVEAEEPLMAFRNRCLRNPSTIQSPRAVLPAVLSESRERSPYASPVLKFLTCAVEDAMGPWSVEISKESCRGEITPPLSNRGQSGPVQRASQVSQTGVTAMFVFRRDTLFTRNSSVLH